MSVGPTTTAERQPPGEPVCTQRKPAPQRPPRRDVAGPPAPSGTPDVYIFRNPTGAAEPVIDATGRLTAARLLPLDSGP
jgi:hypothetical protein